MNYTDIFIDATIDNIKILPFLFLTFLLMEYLEDKMQEKTRQKLKNAGKLGPLFGSIAGAIPQCGISAASSNLYAGRVISIGTLIAIYLSTSDEMLPIMISEAVSVDIIGMVLITKIVYGMFAGFVIDFVARKLLKIEEKEIDIHHFCEHENCECGRGILVPAIKHTVKIFFFLYIISLVLGFSIEYFGFESVSGTILANRFIGPFISGLIGLIPNCAASVLITKLFLEGAISYGTMLSGLFAGAGVGVLVLFRVNENKKENFTILWILYLLGVYGGIILNLFIK